MDTSVPKVLLACEYEQGSSFLVKRLIELGCECSFAASSHEISYLLETASFELLLIPMRLGDVSLFSLARQLRGTGKSLFFAYPVEEGCWWLPALHYGQYCFGSGALRPSEFLVLLGQVVEGIRVGGALETNVADSLGFPPHALNTAFSPRASGGPAGWKPALRRRRAAG